jgi:hypothetical protein
VGQTKGAILPRLGERSGAKSLGIAEREGPLGAVSRRGQRDGDRALRDELKNPRLIQLGSPYGYDRRYAGVLHPAPWPVPSAYQAPGMRQPTRCLRSACPRNGDAEPHCRCRLESCRANHIAAGELLGRGNNLCIE